MVKKRFIRRKNFIIKNKSVFEIQRENNNYNF